MFANSKNFQFRNGLIVGVRKNSNAVRILVCINIVWNEFSFIARFLFIHVYCAVSIDKHYFKLDHIQEYSDRLLTNL